MVAGPLTGQLWSIIAEEDQRLGHPDPFNVYDVGAGDGNLLTELSRTLMEQPADLQQRIRLVGVDLRPRPAGLAPNAQWVVGPAPAALPDGIVGLLLAFELLDDIPTSDGRVMPAATAQSGPMRNQCPRMQLATDLVRRLDRGTAVIVDYSAPNELAEAGGSEREAIEQLVGFRHGFQVPPTTDGATNVTSGVDFTALKERLAAFGEVAVEVQREVLAGSRPPADVRGIERLSWFSQLSELTDPLTLGRHLWLTIRLPEDSNG